MTSALRSLARFPRVAPAAGHYESFYLKAAHPSEPRAVWVRYTVWKAPQARPVGGLWCTMFDAGWPRPLGWKLRVPTEQLGVAPGEYLHLGAARLTPTAAEGPSWQLSIDGAGPPFRYLQRPWLYRAPLPRTKAESLYPAVRFAGWMEHGSQRWELDGWPGMIGHNWGAEHAERWIWMHATTFEDAPDAVFDLTLGRVRIGRWISPWVGNGLLELDGVRHRLGGLQRVPGTRVEETVQSCAFSLSGAGRLAVQGQLAVPAQTLVGWLYADPGGGSHHVVHSSIADLRLTAAGRTLVRRGGTSYELGMRETDHGVPVEPVPDP